MCRNADACVRENTQSQKVLIKPLNLMYGKIAQQLTVHVDRSTLGVDHVLPEIVSTSYGLASYALGCGTRLVMG